MIILRDLVWDPPKKQVNVRRMIIYSFIPILSIYAGWRIQKFWVLFLINLAIGYGVGIPMGAVLPYPYGFAASLVIQVPFTVFIVRHFARKYNSNLDATSS